MPAAAPRDSAIAVVGEGFGSLQIFATGLYLGFRPQDISIFGVNDDPVATYESFARNLGQTVLRSESESHFLPADWPTFAELDFWAHKNPSYLFRSMMRRYNPGVNEILTQARVVARRLNWDGVRVPTRIGWLQRTAGPPAHFILYDEDTNVVGRAKHVMLALGHGPLTFPRVLGKAKQDPVLGERIVQAYEGKRYAPGGRYVVIGAGIASVNEWANILDAGGSVLALTRNPQPDEQDLNVPRCLFEAYGIDRFQGLPFDKRIEFLGSVLKGTRPTREAWESRVNRGRAEGRFDAAVGEIDQVEPGPAGLRIHVSNRHGEDLGWLDVSGVVSGTGFNKSALTLPLLRRLVEHYDIPVVEGRIKLRSNCGLPPLDRPDSRLSTIGLLANNVVPHGDTIAGLKYIARRFVADCARAEGLRKRSFPSRLAMQLSLSREVSAALRQVRETPQLA
jgi:hypothetical protein